MRVRIAAGNWKMNKDFNEGIQLVKDLKEQTTAEKGTMVILGTPYIHLKEAVALTKDTSHIRVAAQNCHEAKSGAYTGEISVEMLKSIDVEYVILGHSERRQYFRETNEMLADKVKAALAGELIPIFCCGESLEIRNEGWHVRYVKNQLQKGLFDLSEEDFSKIIIAYEPIWAIGTGVTASPTQAQEIHKEIRTAIANQYGESVAENTSILYGGSVKPNNAVEIFSQPDVDGGLVGGASLKAELFVPIIQAFTVA
jgi:triosephosphate isomerase